MGKINIVVIKLMKGKKKCTNRAQGTEEKHLLVLFGSVVYGGNVSNEIE